MRTRVFRDADGTSYTCKTITDLEAIAEILNCDLIQAGPSELLLDIDAEYNFSGWRAIHESVLSIVSDHFGPIRFLDSWTSRGGNLHVHLGLGRDLSLQERIALQAILGSDPKREALALWEAQEGFPSTTLFRPRA